MEAIIKKYEEHRKKIKAYGYVMSIVSWDSSTTAPADSFPGRAEHMAVLSAEAYRLQTDPEFVECINTLYENKDKLDNAMLYEIVKAKDTLEEVTKIPKDEYLAYRKIMASSQEIWKKAKHSNDFEAFRPTLEKIVEYLRKYVVYMEKDDLKGYDILLNNYEIGFSTKEYNKFFDVLKKELVPFTKKVLEKELEFSKDFILKFYDKEGQRKFAEYIQEVLCYDTNKGTMGESEHPYTMGLSTNDVRYTINVHENYFLGTIFANIHELGHAINSLQADPSLNKTLVGRPASSAIGESQSRFYENMIGRSRKFWEVHYGKLQEFFVEQLKDVTLDDFYKAINRVENSLIRIEADELTYPIHIMIRYDIERMMIDGEIEVKDLPKVWDDMIKEYLGLDVPELSLGVLQDVHWSMGLYGYFPTYALGSAYAAQMYNKMSQEIDVDKSIESGNTQAVNDWLKEKIHKYGSTKYPKELLLISTGEEFDAMYFVNYLKEKYSKIYGID